MEEALQRHREELIQVAYNICRWHHERYDGRGYPDGLKGEKIPIEAQVVALADVYDALTSVRVYKPAYSHEEAMQMILNGECGSFNPLLLECLQQVGPRLEEELKLRSLRGVSEASIQELSTQMIANGKVSSRTLTLLDQERTRYQFFASMSNEIQFEYSFQSDLLTLSEWGAQLLGLSVLLEHPEENEELGRVFSRDDFADLKRRLRRATAERPIVSVSYCLQVKGEPRWFKAVARPLWENEEEGKVVSIIGKFMDVHEERLQMNRLKKLAEQDPLTKLHNQASAKKTVSKALDIKGAHTALALFDLDNFKDANDRFGHMFGDQVLKHVADIVRKSVRSSDIAARVGGDEFLLFLAYQGDVRPVVDRIFRALYSGYQSFQVSVSMGIALAPENGADYDTLFHAADQALYAAKKGGKNRYCFYDDSMRRLLSVLSPMDH